MPSNERLHRFLMNHLWKETFHISQVVGWSGHLWYLSSSCLLICPCGSLSCADLQYPWFLMVLLIWWSKQPYCASALFKPSPSNHTSHCLNILYQQLSGFQYFSEHLEISCRMDVWQLLHLLYVENKELGVVVRSLSDRNIMSCKYSGKWLPLQAGHSLQTVMMYCCNPISSLFGIRQVWSVEK